MNRCGRPVRMPEPVAASMAWSLVVASLVVLFVAPVAFGLEEAESVAAAPATPEARLELRLDPEAVGRIGIELETATARRREPMVLAYGRVIDPVPLVAAATRLRSAQAQADRARRELQRVEGLARHDRNASARELETARAAATVAEADRELAEAQVVGLFGPTLAASDRWPALTQDLTGGGAALVRVDVPAGSLPPDPARGAQLWIQPGASRSLQAEFFGPAPSANPQLPGWGLLFFVPADAPPPGTPIRARIRTAGDATTGVELPAEALVRDGGASFVFVQREAGAFERVAVHASSSGSGSWLVTSGVEVGDRVVVAGAQQLLSAQLLEADSGGED